MCTREPGGTIEGEIIRKLLVSGNTNTWDPFSEALIFNAIRREHINKVIRPAISDGKIVLCDRFLDSTLIYQGIAGNVNEEVLLKLHKSYCYNLYPNLTFFLNLNPIQGLKRTEKRQNNFEIYDGFKKLQKKFSKRIININADLNKNLISKKINTHILKLILKND